MNLLRLFGEEIPDPELFLISLFIGIILLKVRRSFEMKIEGGQLLFVEWYLNLAIAKEYVTELITRNRLCRVNL